MWFEPERVAEGTWLFEKHAEWLLGSGGTRLLNLGNAEARAWLTDHVDRLLAGWPLSRHEVPAQMSRLAASGLPRLDGDLERLAEILGSLQYLRAVCGANEGQKWRNEMQALIDAEAPRGERRRKIVARFNRGFRGFQQTYRTCTPAADVAIRRYLDEGAKIAREITARYAN